MDNISDIKEKLAQKNKNRADEQQDISPVKTVSKATNPILKKLMQFKNDNLSKKFDINDLLRCPRKIRDKEQNDVNEFLE